MSATALAIDQFQSFRSSRPDLRRAETSNRAPSLPAQASNRLLAALPAAEYQRLLPHLKTVPLVRGQTIYQASSQADQVFFPTSGMVCLTHVTAKGESSELAVVGNEGLVGIFQILSGNICWPYSALVYGAGRALQI